ncbi:redoxin domain-containing protein [Candidatus Methanomassiliicoccus intestinalis]|jgi:alkyl hydroperoxide reductase/ thiol specific antioxidant/ mal allergen|uniref:Thioredoxin domain-containing protein n=1 Tax=Candidatus Methanomassiliicoccus intestinalis TaxID=1406512 RepID=A0A8J8TEB1_9ARCH|nr:MAG: hypothetical protein A3207_05125 [Candidatus Methanomassiliicoccus intestinalis]
MSKNLEVGEPVPDFELPEASTDTIRLSDVYSSHTTVLAFYQSDFGMMCTVEFMKLTEMYPQFKDLGVQILGISTNSMFTHAGWKTRIMIPFPLLADFDASVTELYGVLEGDIGYLEGRSKRAIFVINKEGILVYKWVTDNPALEPDYDKILTVCKNMSD